MCIKSTYICILDAAGLTYSNTSCAILYPQSLDLENLVVLHEIGHILLRQNYPDGGHCDNPECVMFPIIDKNHLTFDQKCLNRFKELNSKNKNKKCQKNYR